MKKKNRGFMLIELMIAVAVLSVMTAVLFQSFVFSRRLDAKSGKEEMLLNAAKKTMEELKGYSFEALEELSEANAKGTVTIGKSQYQYEPLSVEGSGTEKDGYLLKGEYNVSGLRADYLIHAEVDWDPYSAEEDKADGEEATDTPYTINQYRMPNIVDVDNFRNAVITPVMLTKDDENYIDELLIKVNRNEAEQGAEALTGNTGKPSFDRDSISKYLHIDIREKGLKEDGAGAGSKAIAGKSTAGKLIVKTDAIYTVDDAIGSREGESVESGKTIVFSVMSVGKQIIKDEGTGRPVNRIYLFLPNTSEDGISFQKIFVTADTSQTYEFFMIIPEASGIAKDDISLTKTGGADNTPGIELYTNLEQEKPVSLYETEKRLCHMTVMVFEADYDEEGILSVGKEILRLDSTKSK